MQKPQVFAAAIEAKCGDHVRLSIHPSTGQTKLSIPLIPSPKDGSPMSPWHGSVAVGVDGSFRTVHAADVRETHNLVYKDGRPYHFREKSPLYDFGDTRVEFEHLYPCGLVIRPAAGPQGKTSFRDVDVRKLRKLAEIQSPVVLRGFEDTTDRELFIGRAHELGEIQKWTFGELQEVKDGKRSDKLGNNVTSSEAMPMHYDGLFKLVTKKDAEGKEIKVPKPPR